MLKWLHCQNVGPDYHWWDCLCFFFVLNTCAFHQLMYGILILCRVCLCWISPWLWTSDIFSLLPWCQVKYMISSSQWAVAYLMVGWGALGHGPAWLRKSCWMNSLHPLECTAKLKPCPCWAMVTPPTIPWSVSTASLFTGMILFSF